MGKEVELGSKCRKASATEEDGSANSLCKKFINSFVGFISQDFSVNSVITYYKKSEEI